jgi:heavy metal-binding protein
MRLARSWIYQALLTCWTVACASRSVPTSEPRTSAASPEAHEAAPHAVTQALNQDPPLPGPESESWLGLRAPAAAGSDPPHPHVPAPASPAPAHQHGAPAPHQHGASESAPGRNEAPAPGVRYACPMHPEVVSSEPGRCSRCGMPLVQRP